MPSEVAFPTRCTPLARTLRAALISNGTSVFHSKRLTANAVPFALVDIGLRGEFSGEPRATPSGSTFVTAAE